MLNAILPDQTAELNGIALRALNFSDNEITREYDLIVKSKVDKNKNNLPLLASISFHEKLF